MIIIDGKSYLTIEDAGKNLGNVCGKTVREYIRKGIIDQPPKKKWGLREIQVFPNEYLKKAKKQIDDHLSKKRPK